MQPFTPHLEIINAVKKWLTYLEKNLHYSEKTVEAYRHDLLDFVQFMHKKREKSLKLLQLLAVKSSDFEAYLEYRKSDLEISHRSLNRNLSAIKNFYAYQERYTGLRNDDLAHLTLKSSNPKLPRAIDQKDLMDILDYLQTQSHPQEWIRKRNHALALLLYGGGLRISEALSLTFSDVTSRNSFLTIIGKGKKPRQIPYMEIVREAIGHYLKACPYNIQNDQPAFIGIQGKPLNDRVFYKTLQEAYHYLNIPYAFSAHSFRHSCASHLLNNGANLRNIQSLLGHKNLSSTENYLKVDHERLRKVIAKAHPRG